jgi:hypothetical protein
VSEKTQRSAVLQFEIDRPRWNATKGTTFQSDSFTGETPIGRLYGMVKTAACDTLFNGGTFVLVVTDTKVTMIQRSDAEEFP